jgi:hypothetical protein
LSTVAIQIAERFADLLDRREYDLLQHVLSPDCRYELRGRVLGGVSPIIEEYRTATEWAFKVLERIEFESRVVAESPSSNRVTFTDRLFLGDAVHEYRCQQVLTVDDSGQIIHIRHVDLEGQSAALEAFFRKCEIVRPRMDPDGIIGRHSGS